MIDRPSKRIRTKSSQLDILSNHGTSPPLFDTTCSSTLRPCRRDNSEVNEDKGICSLDILAHPGPGDESRSDLHLTPSFPAIMPIAKRRRILQQKTSPENLQSKIFRSDVHMDPHVCVEQALHWPGTTTPRTLSRTTCPILAARFPHLVRPPEPT